MKLPFWKMSGAGNDFVLVAGRPLGRRGPSLARALCGRHDGIGADGLLSLSRRGREVRLDYWNADGSAAFCGNGTRCAALWLSAKGWVKGKRFALATSRGKLDVELTGKGRAQVGMPPPNDFRLNLKLKAGGRPWTVHYVDTGVPHAVVFVPDIGSIAVQELGRELRFHKTFGKAGANVDFVQLIKGTLHLRTYERGVEAETLACGTGVVAAAAVSLLLGKTPETSKVLVRGGETLTVSLLHGHTWLEGPGKVIFAGEVAL